MWQHDMTDDNLFGSSDDTHCTCFICVPMWDETTGKHMCNNCAKEIDKDLMLKDTLDIVGDC